MPNEVNIYTPRYLAEVVRLAPPVFTFFRDTFFTNVRTFPTKAIDFDLVKGDRRMAAFVHPRKGGKVLASAGYETLSYKPPLINPYDVTTADQLMNEKQSLSHFKGRSLCWKASRRCFHRRRKNSAKKKLSAAFLRCSANMGTGFPNHSQHCCPGLLMV